MTDKDWVPPATAFHVEPKEDCPHINNNVDRTVGALSQIFHQYQVNKCSVCNDPKENWICLSCLKIFCSRFVNGHAVEHYETVGHCIVASFSDLSVWCYGCDSYIKDSSLDPSLSAIHMAKFGEPIPSYEFITQIAVEMNATKSEPKEEIKDDKVKVKEEKKEDGNQKNESPSNTNSEESPKTLNSDNSPKVVDNKNAEQQPKNESDENAKDLEDIPSEFLDLLKRFSLMQSDAADKPKEKLPQILTSLTVDGVVEYIKSGRCRNIIVMNGAGISVAAGIPDFRSPQTGLYHNLQKYNLPYAEAIFEIGYFKQRPEAFYALAKELYPGHYKPTPCHWFCYLLHLKKILLRVYTQNIDTLERLTGLPEDKIVEAHGSFATAHCVDCDKEHSSDFVKECVLASKIPRCDQCNGLVKPDIVFFGEGLPPRFFQLMREDFPKCDLLIVMGTSLKVQPFASLINHVSPECPRVLINRDAVGLFDPLQALFGNEGFMFNRPDNYRDVAILGDCQECVKQLVEKLGWKEEFEKLTKTERTQ